MKPDELHLFATIEFTVDGEPGLLMAEGRRLTFKIETFKGLYRVLRMAAEHLAHPRPLIAINKILQTLGLSLTLKVGKSSFFVLGDKSAT